MSAVSVQDSQAHRNMDMTRERISLIFEHTAILIPVIPDGLEFCECCSGVGGPGENFRFGSFICDDCSLVFEPVDVI